jgi:dolichol-phosphate mannosyltransferase
MNKDLTVIIPAYNEGRTVVNVIKEVLNTPRVAEVIVIDDGSKDDTFQYLQQFQGQIKIVRNQPNRGKGFSIRKGIELATSKYLIIQDADLELQPSSFEALFKKMEETGADMVNGARDLDGPNVKLISKLASQMIPIAILILFGQRISDVVCCYKLMETDKYRALNLKSDRFEIETEMILRAIQMHYKIVETKVAFTPRTIEEGKHIRWTDGIKVLKLIFKFRFGLFK